ncbi:protein DDI1 homolog 2-like [Schistocerca americana]|uniref:protein DDI1 homolog 2-like n=1 Tax=Schistocerca americana TaxID=7009 RepID=UPI001F4F9439|nr:protein DDI1 homolog 2-like [Schistocerca americana]
MRGWLEDAIIDDISENISDDLATVRNWLLKNPETAVPLQQDVSWVEDAMASGDIDGFIRAFRKHWQMWHKTQEVESHTVGMLYVKCWVNGCPAKALVDTGAQRTTMSTAYVKRNNLQRMANMRRTGVIGKRHIVGCVPKAQLRIGMELLPASIDIVEGQPMDLVLGLDMLVAHHCCIDLHMNVLRVGTSSTETPFLLQWEPEGSTQPSETRGSISVKPVGQPMSVVEDIELPRPMQDSDAAGVAPQRWQLEGLAVLVRVRGPPCTDSLRWTHRAFRGCKFLDRVTALSMPETVIRTDGGNVSDLRQ